MISKLLLSPALVPDYFKMLQPSLPEFCKMSTVFVYGTLKKGQPNHHHMMDETKRKGVYCGTGRTNQKYPLVIAGKYNIPFLLNLPGTGHEIDGEIYLVDDQLLQFLDEFEGCPEVYQRRPVEVHVLEWEEKASTLGVKPDVGGMLTCFLYNATTYEQDWLKLPYYNNYDPFRNHDQPKYVLREAR
ncbi:gamma-glutamylaminecyclotransferase-like isoform X2 [Carcharodon carcharias]|uniref:gamma-glutamylaminecyclotransferase-like isoform X2 n=1 Tax=Carcharodon carcharias TaxID=13397 RepID=UPI001B7E1315|nr:gamma-glutamylaminecyclotransferase-like isoform X2 [Carcharodon carcharias]